MFNFFRKKTALEIFFKDLSDNQKEAIIISLMVLSECDGALDEQKTELVYTEFIRKSLNVDTNKIKNSVKGAGISSLVDTLKRCSNPQKAIIIFIFRGLINIDKEANSIEIEMLDRISEQLNFNLDSYYASMENSNDNELISILLKELIFPNGLADVEQGGEIINHFLNTKISKEEAIQVFIQIATMYELCKIRSLNNLTIDLDQFSLDIPSENYALIYKFLRGRILTRLSTYLKIK